MKEWAVPHLLIISCSDSPSDRPISQIPQCTCSLSHNAPLRTEMCTFLFWMVHCGIWNRCFCESGQLSFHPLTYIFIYVYIWVRPQRCGCLVTWFCYYLIAKPGNMTATPSWPDPYAFTHSFTHFSTLSPLHFFNQPSIHSFMLINSLLRAFLLCHCP